MRTVGVIQARMSSTRLPGKILMPVLGKPLLAYELERLRRVPSLDVLMVATTTNAADDPVAGLCKRLGVPTHRGSEHDVLSRYYEAAAAQRADAVVRFTADCPLIDPELSESVIRHYLDNAERLDYCALNVCAVPNLFYPRGMDTEIFSMKALRESFEQGHEPADREHVTNYIQKTRPDRFRIWMKPSPADWSHRRLTVDTPEDFALIKEIIERLYPRIPNFSLADVLRLLEENPALAAINGGIEQKAI